MAHDGVIALTDEDLWSGTEPLRCPECIGRSGPSYEQLLMGSNDILLVVKTANVLSGLEASQNDEAPPFSSDHPCPLHRSSDCQRPGERFVVHAFRKKEVVHLEICTTCHEASCV